MGLSSGVIGIAAAANPSIDGHTCAVTQSNQVWCWGLNDHGQLGDGTTTTRLTPVQATGSYGPPDTFPPTITGSAVPGPNANGWNNTQVTVSFTCSDSGSGIASCSAPTVLSTEGAGQSVTGTAVDNAGNTASATVGPINIDLTPPSIVGTPTTAPNAAGWYRDDVDVHWTCSDALSGPDGPCPADSTVTGEGSVLSATASVVDRAGNQATGTVSPIAIDRTAPITTASAPSGWSHLDVTVDLAASDNLSGVEATRFVLDGGPEGTGTSVLIDSEGTHTLSFWSIDRAGNEEADQTIEILIDETAPSITHTLAPEANGNGWNRTNVTVTWLCTDELLRDRDVLRRRDPDGRGSKPAGDRDRDRPGRELGDRRGHGEHRPNAPDHQRGTDHGAQRRRLVPRAGLGGVRLRRHPVRGGELSGPDRALLGG